MDWSDTINIRDHSFPCCYFDYEPESNCSNCSNYVITDREWEETVLNDKACDQAGRILLGEENAEILKLEDGVIILERQLAWDDISWFNITNSCPLSERVKIIDSSITSLKNAYSEDDQSSLLYRELIERWQKVLKHLPEKYFPQKDNQASNLLIEETILTSLQPKTDRIAGEKNVSCSTPVTVRNKDEVKEIIQSNIEEAVLADEHEIGIMAKKSEFSLTMTETTKKESSSFVVWSPSLKPTGKRNYPGMIKPASDLTSDAIIHKIGSEVKKLSGTCLNEDGPKEVKTLRSEDNISLTAAFSNREKEPRLPENVKSAGHILQSGSSDLHKISEETGKDERVSKGTKGDQKTENTKIDTQDIELPGDSLSLTVIDKSDTLLEFYNHQREQLSKIISKDGDDRKAKFLDRKCRPLTDLFLKSQTSKAIEVFKQNVKVEYDLYEPPKQKVDPFSKRQVKRKSQNLHGIQKEKKLKCLDLNHILALPTNSPESSSVESVCCNNLAITDTQMEKTPKVFSSSKLPSAPPGRTDFGKLNLTNLRDTARQLNLKKIHKFTKSRLIEEIRSELVRRDNCT